MDTVLAPWKVEVERLVDEVEYANEVISDYEETIRTLRKENGLINFLNKTFHEHQKVWIDDRVTLNEMLEF